MNNPDKIDKRIIIAAAVIIILIISIVIWNNSRPTAKPTTTQKDILKSFTAPANGAIKPVDPQVLKSFTAPSAKNSKNIPALK